MQYLYVYKKNRASSENKTCNFYDNDCRVWDQKKGNTCKTAFVLQDGVVRHVELEKDTFNQSAPTE